ncbi:DNA methylase [Treponema sp.]|uniref:Y-family DNA polymerase n=1 Tax=Treponema sp. TaxID=166 RepID=UPI003890ACB0
MNRTYIAIDLKSFYASVECVERGMDPLKTNLLVADPTRSDKTICLAVSPSLKSFGVPGRPRLFEAKQKIEQINTERRMMLPSKKFFAKSYLADVLKECMDYEVDYVTAPPRMALYIEYSSRIYRTYLKYIAPEDIHVYSIDEVFIDATPYLKLYGISAHELAVKMIHEVYDTTGITATAGIGPNLFIAKVAMDVVAKKLPADRKGVRIAELDVTEFRKKLWNHKPITDIWRIGPGTANRLAKYGLHTLGDIARCSIGKPNDFLNENILYKEFGINAELLIDHSWGHEPCTIKQIKAYKPKDHSLTNGQVLPRPYAFGEGVTIVREMAELLCLDLVKKGLLVRQICMYVGYDNENAETMSKMPKKQVEDLKICMDPYGRLQPGPAQGRMNLKSFTQNMDTVCDGFEKIYRATVNPEFTIRRLFLIASEITTEEMHEHKDSWFTPDLFESESDRKERVNERLEERKNKNLQDAILTVKGKFGKNTLVRGLSLQEGAMTMTRNKQIGGHQA